MCEEQDESGEILGGIRSLSEKKFGDVTTVLGLGKYECKSWSVEIGDMAGKWSVNGVNEN